MDKLINKGKENAFKLQTLEKLKRDTTAMAQEQYFQLEEMRGNQTTPITSNVETSMVKDYGQARPQTTVRSKQISCTPGTLPLESVQQSARSKVSVRQEQALEQCVSLLRDDVFNTIPDMVNTQ